MGKKKNPKKPRKLSAYNKFVKKHRLAGKSMKQIGRMWKGTGSNPKPKSGGSRRSSSMTRRSNTTMGRKGGFNTQKLYKYIRLAAVGAPVIKGVAQYGFTMPAAVEAIKGYTGVNIATGQFNLQWLIEGWTPAVAATAVTYGVPKLAGIIRGL